MNKKFITLTYKVPSEPSKHRAYIWRQLKELGAVYLSQGVVVLPYSEEYIKAFKKLHDKAIEYNGMATVGIIEFVIEEDYQNVVDVFNNARKEEYNELINNASRLLRTLEWAKEEKLVFSQYEENEEDLLRLQHWLEKIEKRDYFDIEINKEALKKIEEVKHQLSLYHELIMEKEGEFE